MATATKDEKKEIITLIKESQEIKSKQFKEIVENNPNKRIYQQRIIIQWAEVIDVNKDDLRYEDNSEDKKHNRELMRNASADYGIEALRIAKSIQDNEKFCIEEFDYSGREYQNHDDESPEIGVDIQAIDINNAPPELKKVLKSIAQKISEKNPTE